MRRIPFLLMMIFFTSSTLISVAQIRGSITDFANSSSLSGVTVKINGKSTTVVSKEDGSFQINANAGDLLQFSSAGYITKLVSATDNMKVVMRREIKNMEEVVVTAMGITRQTKSLGYSVASLSGDQMTDSRATNFVEGLSGKISGVRVSSQSGALDASAKIIIRGENAFSGTSQPLFVIDGMPMDNSSFGNSFPDKNNNSVGVDYGNRAGDISPDDIESITVLKGAAASALYGSRAKSGAVVMTTKKANKNSFNLSVNTSLRFDNVLKLPSFQNEYANGDSGVYNMQFINGWGPKISSMQNTPVPDFTGQNVILKAYPNNVKDFFQTGRTLINNVNISGGDINSDYRLSLSNTNTTGMVPFSSLDKYNINLNVGKKFTDQFSARASINYVNTTAVGLPSQSSTDINLLMSNVYFPRTLNQAKLKNNYIDSTGKEVSLSTNNTANNPYWITRFNKNNSNLDHVIGNVVLNYKPYPWLQISDNIGTDYYNEYRKSLVRNGTIGQLTGGFATANIYNSNLNNDLVLTIEKKKSNDFNFKFIAGSNFFQNTLRTETVKATGLSVDQLYTLANASSTVPLDYYQRSRLIGLYADAGLSYKNYLFVNITGRNDWNSTLPVNDRSYFYPSISSSFIFTELLPKSDVLSFGKLRAGWANVGGGTDPYMLNFTYSPQATYNVQFFNPGTFPTVGGLLGSSGPAILPNSNLKPSNQQSIEIGTDLKFFKNRIQLAATYYNTQTKNQIFPIDVPLSTGYTQQMINGGCISNNGIELDLGADIIKNPRGFSWNLNLNFNKNKQIVKKIDNEGVYSQLVLDNAFNGMAIKASVGQEFGIYGTDWQKSPDGQIVINQSTGLRQTVSDVRLGNIAPDWTMGINNTFTYKRFSLSALIDIRQGGVVYSGTVSGLRTTGLAAETAKGRESNFVDKGVSFDGTNYAPNTVPVSSMENFWEGNYGYTNTSANLFDASYIKLRQVQFAYSIRMNEKYKVKSVEVGLEARNVLILHSNIPHIDPEVNSFTVNQPGEGVEFFNLPSRRSVGINARFNF